MKKLIALILALAMVSASFISCGNGDKETTTADSGSTTTTSNLDGSDATTTTVADETTTSTEQQETTTSNNVDETTTSNEEGTTTTESSDPADLPEGTRMLEKKTYEYTASDGQVDRTEVATDVLVDQYYLVYNLDQENKTASVGDPYHKYNGSKDLVLPEYCYYEGTLYTITSVGMFWLFCKSLDFTSVTLSKHITKLESGAFNGNKIGQFNWGESKVEYIDQGAFAFTDLTTITIPATVKFIGGQAFRRCNSLKEIKFEGTDIEFHPGINEGIFAYCPLESITIPEGTKEISTKMFHNCVSLTTVNIPSSLEIIAKSAFEGCYMLRSFNMPTEKSNLKSVCANAFLGVTAITSFTFPEGFTTLETNAFNGTNLMVANLPSTIEKIGDNALVSNMLKEINVTEGSAKYSSLDGVLYNADKTELLLYPTAKSAKEFTLPETVTTISYHAIYNCTKLEKLTLNTKLSRIGINTDAFSGCIKLQSITVPEGNAKYKSIDGVLYSADGKTLVQYPIGLATDNFIVPESVTKIGAGAFAFSTKIKAVTVKSGTTVDSLAFESSAAKLNYVD